MDGVRSEIKELESDVELDPDDAFLRCNLACLLAQVGEYNKALMHLSVAMALAKGAVAAGCVAAAIRQVNDEFCRIWQLPSVRSPLDLLSA